MKTALGCLFWIVVFGVLFAIERTDLQSLPALSSLPGWVNGLAATLALGVVLSAGGLHGLFVAWRQREEQTFIGGDGRWEDGAEVRIGGVLEIRGEPLRAPFSGRPAVMFEYEAAPLVVKDSERRDRLPHPRVHGRQRLPCWVRTSTRSIELRGFPCPQPALRTKHTGAAAVDAAARYFAGKRFELAADPERASPLALFARLREIWARVGADTDLHLINTDAREQLQLPLVDEPAAAVDEAALRERLGARKWAFLFSEHVWAPSQKVTAVGTWRANPPHLDIGCDPSHPSRGLLPGLPAERARRAVVQAIVFTLLMIALTALGHLAVRREDGAWLRRGIEALSLETPPISVHEAARFALG